MIDLLSQIVISITVLSGLGIICYTVYKTSYVERDKRAMNDIDRMLRRLVDPLEKRIEALETIITTEER